MCVQFENRNGHKCIKEIHNNLNNICYQIKLLILVRLINVKYYIKGKNYE